MEVSVIIPVYNAEFFLEKAIHSVLQQSEVKEIIVIDDAYPDKALLIAQNLQKQYPQIKILQHPDKKNHGAGASRNLGIQNASFPFIAFLDADDFYLPNRFSKTREIFENNPHIDGVYEAIGFHYYNKNVDMTNFGRIINGQQLTTIKKGIPQNQLFEVFLKGQKGWWSLDGFTIKKSLIKKTGLFDISLKQAEDTDFILRTCLYGNLAEGKLDEAVTMRGVYHENRIHNRTKAQYYKAKMLHKWLKLSLKNNWSSSVNYHIFRSRISYYSLSADKTIPFIKYPIKFIFALSLIIRYPKILTKIF